MQGKPTYKIVKTPIEKVFRNPSNPRTISEEKFKKLLRSVQDAPWMLKLRPIVVNKDGIILGGNQRYRACKEAGFDHVWVIWADDINDDQQRRFIIRDNVDFGRWDQEIVKRIYTQEELDRYGTEISLLEHTAPEADPNIKQPPLMGEDDAVKPDIPPEELERSKKDFNEKTIKQIVFHFPTETYEKVIRDMDDISKELDCDDNSEVLLRLLNFYEVGNGLDVADYDPIEGESREDQD